jgi:hypothetical protein
VPIVKKNNWQIIWNIELQHSSIFVLKRWCKAYKIIGKQVSLSLAYFFELDFFSSNTISKA